MQYYVILQKNTHITYTYIQNNSQFMSIYIHYIHYTMLKIKLNSCLTDKENYPLVKLLMEN